MLQASLAPFLHNRSSGGVALFDVALHKNLGDAVLWAAAARLVPSFHESVKYVCAQTQYPGKVNKLEARRAFPKCNTKHMMRAIGPKGVVLLAPGGNWGDLWWTVHGQRLKYLPEIAAASRAAGSAVQLVQLPQSLTFTTNHKALEDEQVINALPPGMLTLFTRQQDSLEYAHTHYPDTNALLAPDLAFSLGPLMPGTAKYDVLFLMRQDKEAAHSETPLVTVVQPRGGQPGAQPASEAGAGAQAGADQAAAGAASKEDQDEVDEALQQLQQLGLTYAIREWQFEHENYSKEVSKVRSDRWCGVL
jgi:exopolysaccharide biosynthesis predicted pyruvyltransferase EpsI